MSDGYANGPHRPLSKHDILREDQVQDILETLPPIFADRLARHMMATERRLGQLAELKPTGDDPRLAHPVYQLLNAERTTQSMKRDLELLCNRVYTAGWRKGAAQELFDAPGPNLETDPACASLLKALA